MSCIVIILLKNICFVFDLVIFFQETKGGKAHIKVKDSLDIGTCEE